MSGTSWWFAAASTPDLEPDIPQSMRRVQSALDELSINVVAVSADFAERTEAHEANPIFEVG